jgi:tRNA G18 (ribose-2'-O)-methylase SpoU
MNEERVPFQITSGAARYDHIRQLPVTVLLEDIRSLYNVGAFFRTADASRIERLLLCGITGTPPQKGIEKTALGAESTVSWQYAADAADALRIQASCGYETAVVETSIHAVDLFDWEPRFPVCLVFGNELHGVSPAVVALCDTHVRIPMLGYKHSLNVATAGGIVIYELLRKYRDLAR